MPTEKKELTNEGAALNIYQKLAEARARFLATPTKKSGKNTYAEYKYFELEDIVPAATQIFNDLGLLFVVTFRSNDAGTGSLAVGTLFNSDNPEETLTFTSPMIDLVTNDGKYPNGMNSIQALGGSQTYLRRYLYYLVLDVVEADPIDGSAGKPDPETGKGGAKKSNRPATPTERADAKTGLTDKDGEATETQTKAIKNGLKKLRAKDGEKYEDYVKATVVKMKAGLKKTEAEDLLIEIGNKVAEA